MQLDDTLLLIEPAAASAYEAANQPNPAPTVTPPGGGSLTPLDSYSTPVINDREDLAPVPGSGPSAHPTPAAPTKAKSFVGSADVSPAAAKMRLVQIAEEIIAVLAADPNANIKVRVEIQADFAHGAQDQTKRAVSENAKTLNFGTAEWE